MSSQRPEELWEVHFPGEGRGNYRGRSRTERRGEPETVAGGSLLPGQPDGQRNLQDTLHGATGNPFRYTERKVEICSLFFFSQTRLYTTGEGVYRTGPDTGWTSVY